MQSTTRTQSTSPFRAAADAAMRRALVSGAVVSVVTGLVALVVLTLTVNVVVGLIAAVVVITGASVAWVSHVQQGFGGVVAAVTGDLGRPVDRDDQPTMANALEGVAILTGVKAPDMRMLEVDSANAMVASDGERSTVVITTGLLQGCRTVEAEVIAAELLCRVRDGSARYATLGAGLPPLLRRAAGVDQSAVADLLGEQRAVHCDADAVAVTRYPPGLVAALERMAEMGTRVEDAQALTAPLWIAPAVGVAEGVTASVDRTVNQSLDYRIAVLREL